MSKKIGTLRNLDVRTLWASEAKDFTPWLAKEENIERFGNALGQYWSKHFESDPIERVYVVYFLEGVFDEPDPSPFHLHIHLIPRTAKLGRLLRKKTENGSTINAWKIYKLHEHPGLPKEYKKCKGPAEDLMDALEKYLDKASD